MIGISISAKEEWKVVLDKYGIKIEDCQKYPYGEYFQTKSNRKTLVFFRCGIRKTNCSAATQYMIDHFKLKKVIFIGTCGGIDPNHKVLDIIIPNRLVQYDCTVKEFQPLINESLSVYIATNAQTEANTGTLGTADKAVVAWKDYLELQANGITIADTEAASVAYVCKTNNVECVVIKGISDYPINEAETPKNNSFQNQFAAYITNVPLVMQNILDNYLDFAINNTFYYVGPQTNPQ